MLSTLSETVRTIALQRIIAHTFMNHRKVLSRENRQKPNKKLHFTYIKHTTPFHHKLTQHHNHIVVSIIFLFIIVFSYTNQIIKLSQTDATPQSHCCFNHLPFSLLSFPLLYPDHKISIKHIPFSDYILTIHTNQNHFHHSPSSCTPFIFSFLSTCIYTFFSCNQR